MDPDKLSYEIFSILESKFLFGYHDQDDHLWVPKPISQRGKVCILSIDSDLTLLDTLLASKSLTLLETSLRSLSGDPHATISSFFDVAAGSGVGGVLTAMLFTSPSPYPADQTWPHLSKLAHLLWDREPTTEPPSSAMGCCAFPRRRRRPSAVPAATRSVESWLREVFPESLTLKDTSKPVLVTCYDMNRAAPMLFSRADAVESDGFDFRLWEICRATLAEPGRFEPAQVVSLDGSNRFVALAGGLAASNPTIAAITHVVHNKQEFPFVRGVEDLLVLSIGRGSGGPAVAEYETVRRWRDEEWAGPVRDIMGGASAELADHAVGMAFGNSRVAGNYVRVRLDRVGLTGLDMDKMADMVEAELRRRNVECAMFGGQRIGEQTNAERLKWFAGELVAEHRRRGDRIAPTVAFKPVGLRKAEDFGKI